MSTPHFAWVNSLWLLFYFCFVLTSVLLELMGYAQHRSDTIMYKYITLQAAKKYIYNKFVFHLIWTADYSTLLSELPQRIWTIALPFCNLNKRSHAQTIDINLKLLKPRVLIELHIDNNYIHLRIQQIQLAASDCKINHNAPNFTVCFLFTLFGLGNLLMTNTVVAHITII